MMRFDRTQLPENWDVVTIGDCCDILDSERVPLNRKERREREGDIPYYGANGQVGWVDDWIFDAELVLLAEDGGHFDEYETRPIAYRISGKSWVNNHAHVLRARSMTSNDWVYYNLVHRDLRKHIKGGTRDKLNQGDLRQVQLPFPPKDVQRRIAALLDTVDAAIRETDAVIAKQEQVKTGLLQDLLTRGLDADGRLRDSACHPEQFRATALGRLPAVWDVLQFSEIVELRHGFQFRSHHFSEKGYPVIKIRNVSSDGVLDLTDLTYIPRSEAEKYEDVELFEGDLLMSLTGNIGRVVVVPSTNTRLFQNYRVGRFTSLDESSLSNEFLALVLSSDIVSEQVRRKSNKTAQANIGKGEFEQTYLPVPPLSEQQEISKMFEEQAVCIRRETAYLNKLQRLKTGLMQDLLTGRKRVPEIADQVAEAVA